MPIKLFINGVDSSHHRLLRYRVKRMPKCMFEAMSEQGLECYHTAILGTSVIDELVLYMD